MNIEKQSIYKEIISIALPMTGETFLEILVGSIDVWVVAQIGLVYVTAVGVSNSLMALYLAIFVALGVGANAILSKKIGANRIEQAASLSKYILWTTVLVGLLLGVLTLLFGKTILHFLGISDKSLDAAYIYSALVGGTAVFMGLITVLSGMLRVLGYTRFPLLISLFINVLNALFSLLLAFGWCGIPAMGITGVALGTVFSRMIGTICLFYRLSQTNLWQKVESKHQHSNKDFVDFLHVSYPVLGERLLMRGGQVLYMSLIVAISSQTYSAHSIAGTIENFVYMPIYGFAAAATILTARSIGEGSTKQIKSVVNQSLLISVAVLSTFALIQFFMADSLARIYTTDTTVLPQIIRALQLSALGQPFLAIGHVLAGALQGAEDIEHLSSVHLLVC